ncbi:MAG: hypothetical protein K2G37_01035 [Clostridia bacterium]|nr:hypothetical protein [Clostridia bacterium]MDE7328908.1 hypothetical protein [Clostridia bacterium]
MKKPKFINKKWLVITVIALVLVVFSFLNEQKSINAQTIVLALSLDKNGDEYEMGVQALKTTETEKQEFISYFAKGDNLSDIIEKLNYDTGNTLTLCHAMVLILGQNVLNQDDDKAMRFFFEGQILCNNTMVVAAKDNPKDVLSPTLTNGIGAGYYLGTMLRNVGGDLGVIPMTIKDYFKNKFRIGSCIYLPCVAYKEEGDSKYLDVTESYISDGKTGVILSETATRGLSLVLNNGVGHGSIPFDTETSMGEVNLVKSSADIKIEKTADTAKLQIKTTVKNKTYVAGKINDEECKKYVGNKITEYVNECYEQCKSAGLDVFYLGQRCYAYENELYKDPDYIDKIKLEVEVKISLK